MKFTLQEKEVLYAVAREKCREIEAAIVRVRPGKPSKYLIEDLHFWERLQAKFNPDTEDPQSER